MNWIKNKLSRKTLVLSVLSTYLLVLPLTFFSLSLSTHILIALGFALLLNFVMYRLISHPISTLVKKLSEIEDFTHAPALEIDSNDEIGELQRQYNRILLQLQSLTHDLEERVDERTKELETKQQELIRVEKLASIGELAAGAAHEINNPLAILAANMDELKSKIEKRELLNLERYYKAHNLTVDRISSITGNLSYFARDEGDEIRPQEVHRFIRESVEMLEGIYRKLDIKIVTEFEATGSIINANIGKLQQILFNLMSNARDALNGVENAVIQISTRTHHGQIIIDVNDNGCGMSPQVREKIFDSFFTTKPAGKGTGLGMPLVAQFVSEFDGKIELESTEGEGTTIRLFFPLTSEKDFKDKQDTNQAQPEKLRLAGNVLFAEDEPLLREYFKIYLNSFGLNIDCAENGAEALEMIRIKHYDVLLTDIQMPRMSGDELIHSLNREGISIPIIVVTGGVNPTAKIKSAFDKAESVLSKPVDKDFLIHEIDRVLCNQKHGVVTKLEKKVNPSILLIDDEVDLLELNSSQLKLFDYITFCASNAPQALEIAKKEKPDYVLLDFNVPGSMVDETVKSIQHLSPTTKIMVISGEDMVTIQRRLKGLNIFLMLTKPCGMTSVHEKIQKDLALLSAA